MRASPVVRLGFGIALSLACLFLGPVGPASAEEARAQATLQWTGRVLQHGEHLGTFSLRGEAIAEGGAWSVQESFTPVGATKPQAAMSATLDGRLRLLRGTAQREKPMLRASMVAHDDGRVTLEQATSDYENVLHFKAETRPLCTLAAWVLGLASGQLRAGSTTPEFDAAPSGGGQHMGALRVVRSGPAPWLVDGVRRELTTWVVDRSGQRVRLAFKAGPSPQAASDLLVVAWVGRGLRAVASSVKDVTWAGAADELQTKRRAARARGERRRAALGSTPGAMHFEGDVLLHGVRIGDVSLRARQESVGGELGWRVEERVSRSGGEATVTQESALRLRGDLSVHEGTWRFRSPTLAEALSFVREGDALRVVRRPWAGGAITQRLELDASMQPLFSTSALLLLAQGKYEASMRSPWRVPTLDLWSLPRTGEGRVAGGVTWVDVSARPGAGETEVFVRTPRGFATTYRLDGTGQLRSADGKQPRTQWVARGSRGKAMDWFENTDATPQNAYQAFVRFGRGYHLPRKDLLLRAFDWERMRARGIEAGTWTDDVSLETVQEAWIEQFVAQSKHRTVADCDDLLMQIFMTMDVVHNKDGSITFASIPTYGGHRYHLDEADGAWRLVGID